MPGVRAKHCGKMRADGPRPEKDRVTLEPSLFVIFGATGDLSARKLLPALCKLAAAGVLHPNTQVVGLGRGAKTREVFQDLGA